tara:strand:+ start:3005 stop:3565 length:561 start_codon:yes stop_codon:yes gene_type:complete
MFKRLKRFFSRFKRRSKIPQIKSKPRLRFILDARSKKAIESLNKKVQPEFIKLMQIAKARGKIYGVDIKAISGHRSYFEQQTLYAKGRTRPGNIITYAKAGYSRHNFGLALDLGVFSLEGDYLDSSNPTLVGKIYKSIWNNCEADKLNIEWGGNWKRFKDTPHFEYKTGLSLAQMREYKKEGLDII